MTYEIGNDTIEFINVEDYGRNEQTGELTVNKNTQIAIINKLSFKEFGEVSISVGTVSFLLFVNKKTTGSNSSKITITIIAKDTGENNG